LNGELNLCPAKALDVVLDSVSAAHRYVRLQNQQLNDFERARARTIIQRACRRLSKCIKRAPAALRHRLDQAILPLIQERVIDLEIIETIFEAATKVLEEFPSSEPSSTSATALCQLRTHPFSMLGKAARSQVEKALAEHVTASPAKRSAALNTVTASPAKHSADVFATIAAVLHARETKPSTNTSKMIAGYVADLAEIWRQAGLKPSRAVGFLNPKYRTMFHRFAELILAAMAGPRTERLASGELIGDDDVRAALRRIQILGLRIPLAK
jgi:hypothetical protein